MTWSGRNFPENGPLGQPSRLVVHTTLDPAKALSDAGDVLRCHGRADCGRSSRRHDPHLRRILTDEGPMGPGLFFEGSCGPSADLQGLLLVHLVDTKEKLVCWARPTGAVFGGSPFARHKQELLGIQRFMRGERLGGKTGLLLSSRQDQKEGLWLARGLAGFCSS